MQVKVLISFSINERPQKIEFLFFNSLPNNVISNQEVRTFQVGPLPVTASWPLPPQFSTYAYLAKELDDVEVDQYFDANLSFHSYTVCSWYGSYFSHTTWFHDANTIRMKYLQFGHFHYSQNPQWALSQG